MDNNFLFYDFELTTNEFYDGFFEGADDQRLRHFH